MKICTKCGVAYPPDNFYRNGASGVRRPDCKQCSKKRTKAHRLENAESYKKAGAEYYAKNREKRVQSTAEWRAANPGRNADNARKWRQENPERAKAGNDAWRSNNRVRVNTTRKAWADSNRHITRASSAKFYRANREKMAEYSRAWTKKNASIANAKTAMRRAMRIQATPKWADQRALHQYFVIARFLSAELGIKFGVDHIVPLKSDLVCGLHCEQNMTLMLDSWNKSKCNRYWPDMPEQPQLALAA